MTFEQQVTRKRNLIRKHQLELAKLLEQCTHEGHVEEKSRYFSGSYTDTAHTTYWNECTLCGERSEDTVKDHSWYG
jgi:hypothetical protein